MNQNPKSLYNIICIELLIINFKAKIAPFTVEDGDVVLNTDLEEVNEHKVKIFCGSGESECDESSFMFYPQVNHEKYRLHL